MWRGHGDLLDILHRSLFFNATNSRLTLRLKDKDYCDTFVSLKIQIVFELGAKGGVLNLNTYSINSLAIISFSNSTKSIY